MFPDPLIFEIEYPEDKSAYQGEYYNPTILKKIKREKENQKIPFREQFDY